MTDKIKVVIGDDSSEFGCTFANSLRGRGYYAVTRARDGLALLDSVREDAPDIVITDAVIPGIDAVELIRRSSQLVKKPFFIVTSSYNNGADLGACRTQRCKRQRHGAYRYRDNPPDRHSRTYKGISLSP